jgi:hypothetical protein
MTDGAMRELRVSVNAANPGEFLACCGMLELADRIWGAAEGWFENRAFCLSGGSDLLAILRALTAEPVAEITRLASGVDVKPLIAPLELRLPGHSPLVLDAWMRIARVKGEVVAIANAPWNFWSGQQTSLRIWTALRAAATTQIGDLGGNLGAEVLSRRVPLSGRFGFDPGAAWSALDVGFSPNEQGMQVASSPIVELLAAVGLQRFRPEVARDRATFDYGCWNAPLAVSVAPAAASGRVSIVPTKFFRGRVVSRGSYSGLGYSTPLEGVTHE